MIGPRMNLLRLLVALALAALCLTPVKAEGDERTPGRIILSDGTVFEGGIRTTRGKPLRLVEAETGRRLDFQPAEIHSIRVFIESEEQYRVWRWVEDGSREKVYTGESYPKRQYETLVTLKTGQIHLGHLVAVLYVYVEGRAKPKKLFLKQKEQGEIGETLKDIVYVESVEFAGPVPDSIPDDTGIQLTVNPIDLVLAAHALPRNRFRATPGILSQLNGPVNFTNLLPGTYDLTVVTEEKMYVGLAVGESGGKPLTAEVLLKVKQRVAEIPDFFEKRVVLAGVREGAKLRILVFKERQGPTSMGGQRTFRRWEIWSMRKGGDRWLVDDRAYLWREHGEALPPLPEIVLESKLLGLEVESGLVTASFTLTGEDDHD